MQQRVPVILLIFIGGRLPVLPLDLRAFPFFPAFSFLPCIVMVFVLKLNNAYLLDTSAQRSDTQTTTVVGTGHKNGVGCLFRTFEADLVEPKPLVSALATTCRRSCTAPRGKGFVAKRNPNIVCTQSRVLHDVYRRYFVLWCDVVWLSGFGENRRNQVHDKHTRPRRYYYMADKVSYVDCEWQRFSSGASASFKMHGRYESSES